MSDSSLTPIPFLQQLAEAYCNNEKDRLPEFCFITPNKRSGVFLSHHFSRCLRRNGEAALLPKVMTISDFVLSLTDTVEAGRMELLFILYNVYSEIAERYKAPGNEAPAVDFNRFQRWGEILLGDFNDVDRYVVDPHQIFRNLESLKEISSNFLTEEQIDVIRKYWNEELVPEPVREFWKHAVHKGDTKTKKRNVAGFVKLWQVMEEVYNAFRGRLRDMGLSYSGMNYRDAVDAVKRMEADDFPFSRYVFVGFNVLSTSEHDIFESLMQLGIADFYWDCASPAFKMAGNRAARFIKKNAKEFPSIYPNVGLSEADWFPQIDIMAVPSTYGQTKLLPDIMRRILPLDTPERLVRNAIVLPDEHLVQPVLNALPRDIPAVNVTMGFTLGHTNTAGLIRSIVSLQLRARQLKAEDTFYYEDIVAVLTHPMVKGVYSRLCDDIVADIRRKRLYNIPVKYFDNEAYEAVRPVFEVVSNVNDPDAVIGYYDRMLTWVAALVADSQSIEMLIVEAYRDAIAELQLLCKVYLDTEKVFLEDKTVFQLIERIVGNQTVRLQGVPLEGLQVMGVLETRSLDFENVVIMSMNERIFPRKHYSPSFIPNAMRRGYRMATVEHQDIMYAYYFYRLISRAKRVFLLYDSRTTGIRSGGPSRYINQLRYTWPAGRVLTHNCSYSLSSINEPVLEVHKDEYALSRLASFKTPGGRSLSAAAINDFINCPLKFYLSRVEGFKEPDEQLNYMDEGTYGEIIHDVCQRMYEDARGDEPLLMVTDELLTRLSDKELIGRYLHQAINSYYLKRHADDPTPLSGDAAIYHKVMSQQIARLFEREREFADKAAFMEGEQNDYVRLRVSDRHTINFNYRIDRVDKLITDDGKEAVRLVDYKTGSDALSAKDFEEAFNPLSDNRPKAFVQLYLYCNAYAQAKNFSGLIQPFIYGLKTIAITPLKPLKLGGQPIADYRDSNELFLSRLDMLLDEMFDPQKPFRANPGEHNCKYCHFRDICRVE